MKYLPLIVSSVIGLAMLLFSAREWYLAKRMYGGKLGAAVRTMLGLWFLGRRHRWFYGSIILLCSALSLALDTRVRLDPMGTAVVIMLVAVALSTFSWNLMPAGVLFLASSKKLSEPLRAKVQRAGKMEGFRTVYLLREQMTSAMDSYLFELGNLRTKNDAIWKEVLDNLIVMSPVIVLDLRSETEGVSHELDQILKKRLHAKCLFIAERGEARNEFTRRVTAELRNDCSRSLIDPAHDDIEGPVRRRLEQARVAAVSGSALQAELAPPQTSPKPLTVRAAIWILGSLCGAVITAAFAYSLFSAQIIVGSGDVRDPALTADATARERNAVILRPGGNIEQAQIGVTLACGSLAGMALSLGVSGLRTLKKIRLRVPGSGRDGNNTPERTEHSRPANVRYRYGCSFILLLDGDSIMHHRQTIDSVSSFISKSRIVSREHSQIVCVWKPPAGERPPEIEGLEVVDPVSPTNFGDSLDEYPGPRVVGLFHLGSRKAYGEFKILLSPGSLIRDPEALEVAICHVADNRFAAAVSHDHGKAALPRSLIMAASAALGSTLGAACGYGVVVKRPLLGMPRYQFADIEMTKDVPWLIAAIASEFQRGRSGVGTTVEVIPWT